MDQIKLNEVQLDEIRRLARANRQSLGFIEAPIASDIFVILDKLDIILLEYPIVSENDRPAFSAVILCSEVNNKKLTFIGLNTADYLDRQIFAIAHELYHYFTKSGSHITRIEENTNNLVEAKANRFAAEFLLPEAVLESIVLDDFRKKSLADVSQRTLLRFIARLHCTWWLPYRSLVKRLYEIDAISLTQYSELYAIDERNPEGEFGRICQGFNKDVFLKLNTPTNNIGTSPGAIEIILRNYEDDLIDEEKLIEILGLFRRTPDEFGYEIKIAQEDMDELEAFFSGVDIDES